MKRGSGTGLAREAAEVSGLVLTTLQLAEALKVSRNTLYRMIRNGDVTPLGGMGKVLRFYLPHVLEELRGKPRKFGRQAETGAELTPRR